MKISIITTVYRAEKDLPRLLESMMAQKSPELEFFLIDNGSPDRCGEICREYAKKDPRFTLFTIKENIGYIRARNVGIQECSGDYIGFCDSDDYLEPGGYDRAVEQIRKTQCDFYATAWRTVCDASTDNFLPLPAGVYTGQDVLPLAFGPIGGKGMLHGFAWKHVYRRSIVREGRLTFIEDLKPYEDQIFNIDVLKQCESVCIDDHIIYNYIVNDQSITAQMAMNFDAEGEWQRIAALYKEKAARAEEPIHTKALCNQALQSLYSLALNMARSRDYSINQAVENFRRWEKTGLLHVMEKGASKEQTPRLRLIKWGLKRRQYYFMIAVLSTALKFRRG